MDSTEHKKIERIVAHAYFESLPYTISIPVDDLPPHFSINQGDTIVFKEQDDTGALTGRVVERKIIDVRSGSFQGKDGEGTHGKAYFSLTLT